MQAIIQNIFDNIAFCLEQISRLEDHALSDKNQDLIRKVEILKAQYRSFYQEMIDDIFAFLSAEIPDLNKVYDDVKNLKIIVTDLSNSSQIPSFQSINQSLDNINQLLDFIKNYHLPLPAEELEQVKSAILIFRLEDLY